MTIPTNTYTVTISDAHSHSFQLPSSPGNTNLPMNGKLQAAADALRAIEAQEATLLAAFTAGDTLTITVTQP
jgi:hypothetical protein